MKLLIITHVPHIKKGDLFFAYRPYVDEMNIWIKNTSELMVLAPIVDEKITGIHSSYHTDRVDFRKVSGFDIIGWKAKIKAMVVLPKIIRTMVRAMREADHIHLRCPGNIGLLGCVVQIFFPKKKKTAKYAGNWDPHSKQPWSYRIQQWILSNTFLTRNMQVMVYGVWPNQTKNVKPFFTATYTETEKQPVVQRKWDQIELLFVGTLSAGKSPMYAVQLAERLVKNGFPVRLRLYGAGPEMHSIAAYIDKHNLNQVVALMGNQSRSALKQAYQHSHFLLLPSQSEGWPKAVAEAMFWGCIPVATAISCVPYMLENGKRGLLLTEHLETDVSQLTAIIKNQEAFEQLSGNAVNWSRAYTMERFEVEIQKLLA